MANQLLTKSDITNEGLLVLENELTYTMHVRRDYDDRFGEEGAKIGDTINIRKPPRFLSTRGQALQLQDAVETSVPLVLATQYQQSMAFTSKDLKLSIDMFSERFIKPSIVPLANAVDYDGLQLFLQVYNEVGTVGTVPNQLLTYLQAAQKLYEASVPNDDWSLVLTPAMQVTIVDALKGVFNPQARIGEQYAKGLMGKDTAGFARWLLDQNCPTFTTGAQGGTPVVSAAAGQTGSTINTTGWTASTLVLLKGDIVQFTGCYAVNYVGKQQLQSLANWVVTANVTSGSGAGAAAIPIAGPDGAGIITSGATQNCSASPTASGAVIVNPGSGTTSSTGSTVSGRGLAYHKSFAAFGCADLPLFDGLDMAERATDDELGLSIRLISAYDINTDRRPTRLDLLGGWAVLYPQFCVRIAS